MAHTHQMPSDLLQQCRRPPRGQLFRQNLPHQIKKSKPRACRANATQDSGEGEPSHRPPPPSPHPRRSVGLFLGATAASTLLPAWKAHGRPADDDDEIDKYFPSLSHSPSSNSGTASDTRPGALATEPGASGPQNRGVDESVTDVVYMDIGVCPEGLRANRTLGDKSAICSTSEPLGRIVIGLYGNQVPTTVRNFKTLMESGAYNGTTFNKVLPGEFIQAGRQGSKRMGEVAAPPDLAPNEDVLSPNAFRVRHNRPGTVSLALAENDDEPFIKQRSTYRPTEFLITTGPGPAPSLDGQNVVFGRVLEGLDTVSAVARLPTFRPAERIQSLNLVASFIGDERAAKVRAKYGRPLRSIVITDSGILPPTSITGALGRS